MFFYSPQQRSSLKLDQKLFLISRFNTFLFG
ncbi:Uncharacterised protein [Vibrio cholerae]|nr:Uncharacterised protein [Vibrio cholerae]